MLDSSVDPGEFQKLIGNIMKQKYEHEQRVADNDLSRHRQKTERSLSASRTPDKRRSISNASRGSRFAEQRSSSVQPGGRPPFIPSRGRTPTQAIESLQPVMHEPNSTSSDTKTDDIRDKKSKDKNNDVQPTNFHLDFTNFTTALNVLQKRDNDDDNVQNKVNVVPMESETLREGSSFTPTARRHKFIRSLKLDTGVSSASSHGDAKEDHLKLQTPLVECSRCVALETKVHEMQDTLNKLSTEVTLLAAKQGSIDNNKLMANETISELPENLDELGRTMEGRFLIVVTALAKRVSQLEVDLEASLKQVRIMEAAAIERGVKLNQKKVGHDQIAGSVAEVLQQVPIEYERDVLNLYKILGLDTNSVHKVLNSSNPSEYVDMLLSTPAFSRILGLVMDNNNDIFNTVQGQGFREEDFSYYDQAPLSSRHSNSLTPRQKIPVPLHEQLLGIVLQDEKDLLGVRVIYVPPRSSAARAVRPGDVIVQVNRVTVHSIADISYVLSRVQPNSLITLGMQAPDEPDVEVVRVTPLEVL
ncbi:PDZ domain [Trypanosoma melophagium]|uniref:PDZ domain n=1 Tax=Trypanosoma melophagium TaxID=715481 RepID=UPI00351A9777|nr:PDZ domain [Trypanosoma melophagium]